MTSPKFLRFYVAYGPFVSEWEEMPCEVFRTEQEARAVALEFVSRWNAGGYNEESQTYWAREHIGRNLRFTSFYIAELCDEELLRRLEANKSSVQR